MKQMKFTTAWVPNNRRSSRGQRTKAKKVLLLLPTDMVREKNDMVILVRCFYFQGAHFHLYGENH
jgi:hypothetical protein